MKFHVFALLIASCASNSCVRESMRSPGSLYTTNRSTEEQRHAANQANAIRGRIQELIRKREELEKKHKELEKIVNGDDICSLCVIQ